MLFTYNFIRALFMQREANVRQRVKALVVVAVVHEAIFSESFFFCVQGAGKQGSSTSGESACRNSSSWQPERVDHTSC